MNMGKKSKVIGIPIFYNVLHCNNSSGRQFKVSMTVTEKHFLTFNQTCGLNNLYECPYKMVLEN